MNELDILMCFENNFAPIAGIAIRSVIESNIDEFDNITFHLFVDDVSSDRKNKLLDEVQDFNKVHLKFYDVHEIIKPYFENFDLSLTLSSYSRLVAAEILPKELKRILYLDCDLVVVGSLRDIMRTDLQGYYAAAVVDQFVDNAHKENIGMLQTQRYYNSGVLLIDLDEWRNNKLLESRFIEYGKSHLDVITMHDQDILNGSISDYIKPLPLKYNLFAGYYIIKLKKHYKIYRIDDPHFSFSDIAEAKGAPVIIHYAGAKPWDSKGYKRKFPYSIYYEIKKRSAWVDIIEQRRKISFKRRLASLVIYLFPVWVVQILRKTVRFFRKKTG